MKLIDIWINCPDLETARKISNQLLQQRLVACSNIYPEIESAYHWKGEIETDSEIPLLLKTRATLFDAVAAVVAGLHPYETPGIVAVPMEYVNDDYKQWLIAETVGPV